MMSGGARGAPVSVTPTHPSVQQLANSYSASTGVQTVGGQTGHRQSSSFNAIKPLFLRKSHLRSWSLEIGAASLRLASFASAIAVLASQNNKTLTNWTFDAPVNTIIAVLGTICRNTLAFAVSACIGQQKWNWHRTRTDNLTAFERFDEASRGPWGGTKLLGWLRFRHWAALGAFATVLFVAFDPFLQATIDYTGRLDAVSSTTATVTNRLVRLHVGQVDRSQIWTYSFTPALLMVQAIIAVSPQSKST